MFETADLERLSSVLLALVEMEQKASIQPAVFRGMCEQMIDAIEQVLDRRSVRSPHRVVQVVAFENLESDSDSDNQTDNPVKFDTVARSGPREVLERIFDRYESPYEGIVHDRHIAEALQSVASWKGRFSDAVFDVLERLGQLTEASEVDKSTQLVFDKFSGTASFRFSTYLMKHPDIGSIGLIHRYPIKVRKNGINSELYSTNEMEAAFIGYKESCRAVEVKLMQVLRRLRDRLSCEALVFACRFSIAAQSLLQHSWEARERQWCLPQLTDRKPLKMTNVWPYWLDRSDAKTVSNSLELKDMVLLTGPNMAGKSTVLRSVAAVAMLALAGLYVPAEVVVCPFLDHIVLRCFSGDNPLCRHSGFSVEMAEMHLAVKQCTKQSLILVDELGKGTEVKTGSGMSASLLEFFAQKRSIGMFSTHLHLIKKMPLNMDGISLMKMNTKAIEPDEVQRMPLEEFHIPEWIVTPGALTSKDSNECS